jgi:hypothetical protein
MFQNVCSWLEKIVVVLLPAKFEGYFIPKLRIAWDLGATGSLVMEQRSSVLYCHRVTQLTEVLIYQRRKLR